MLSSLQNNLKELPQVGVTSLHRSVGIAASTRGDNFNMEQEIWNDIPNYEGYFQISNLLRIRGFYHCACGVMKKYPSPKIRKVCQSTTYPMIVIGFEKLNTKRTMYMHHIVANVFIPNPNNYPVIMHKDDNKKNYSIDNLKWGTNSDNIQSAFRNGLMVKNMGSNNVRSKINETIALEIFNYKGKGYELRHKYGVTYTVIHNIKNGYTWNHVTGLPLKRKTKLGL